MSIYIYRINTETHKTCSISTFFRAEMLTADNNFFRKKISLYISLCMAAYLYIINIFVLYQTNFLFFWQQSVSLFKIIANGGDTSIIVIFKLFDVIFVSKKDAPKFGISIYVHHSILIKFLSKEHNREVWD